MLDMQTIRAAAARLAAAASSPSRVIVFGSYARGTADEGSDLDLMVVERELTDKAGEYLRLREALGRVAPGVGVDLLLYPLAEFERRSQVPGTVLFEARMDGKVLHDAIHRGGRTPAAPGPARLPDLRDIAFPPGGANCSHLLSRPAMRREIPQSGNDRQPSLFSLHA